MVVSGNNVFGLLGVCKLDIMLLGMWSIASIKDAMCSLYTAVGMLL